MQPIVVSLDTSVLSSHSLPLARAVARRSGAPVHLVRTELKAPGAESAFRGRVIRDTWESYLDDAGRYFFADLGPARVRTSMLSGEDVIETLAEYARTHDAGLVVMTANGLQSDHYARGLAAAARVGKRTGLPVLVAHPRVDTRDHAGDGEIQRVLMVLSGSEHDQAVVESMSSIGGGGAVHCTLVHVMPVSGAAGKSVAEPLVSRCIAGRGESVQGYLRAHGEMLKASGHRADIWVVASDQPAEEVSAIAEQLRSDMLVVGTDEVGFQSLAFVVFRKLRVPLLMVGSEVAPKRGRKRAEPRAVHVAPEDEVGAGAA
jgi:nucleotide-binding universal stress UspA family protein